MFGGEKGDRFQKVIEALHGFQPTDGADHQAVLRHTQPPPCFDRGTLPAEAFGVHSVRNGPDALGGDVGAPHPVAPRRVADRDGLVQTPIAHAFQEAMAEAGARLLEVVGRVYVKRTEDARDAGQASGKGRLLAAGVIGVQQVHAAALEVADQGAATLADAAPELQAGRC